MFKLIDRYIARQVILASILVILLLVLLRSLFGLIDELSDLGKGGYQLTDALLYTGLQMPSQLLEFFPMGVLIGALFALGAMAANSELTVMRAAGMTSWQIAGSSIKASLLLMLIVVVVGEWVAPPATKAAQQLRAAAISGGELTLSKTGLWAKRDNQIIRIGSVLSDGQLRDITFYQLSPEYTLEAIVQAEQATFNSESNASGQARTQNKTEPVWILNQLVETRFYEDRISTTKEAARVWVNPLKQSQIETLTLEPESLNLAGLNSYLKYLRQNGLQTTIFELAFWRKLLQPVAIAVMMFLAVSFVFGPMRSVSMGARVLSGVMLGFAFHLSNQSFGPVSLVFNLSPLFGAVIPLLIFAGLALWLMKRNS